MALIDDKVALFASDVDKAHRIINGPGEGPEAIVQTDGGPVRTLAKIGADAAEVVEEAVDNFLQDQTLVDAASIAWNFDLGHTARVTLGALAAGQKRTLPNPTNLKRTHGYLIIDQDGLGNRKIDFWGSAFRFPGGIAPVLSTAPNRRDVFFYVCDGTNMYVANQILGAAVAGAGTGEVIAPPPAGATPAPIVLQAEQAELAGTLHMESSGLSGYTGTGYVMWWENAGDKATFRFPGVAEGVWDIAIRYARDLSTSQNFVSVNGAPPTDVAFEMVPNFGWADKVIPNVPLHAGTNLMEITKGDGFFAVDKVTLTWKAGTPPVVIDPGTSAPPPPAPTPAPPSPPQITAMPNKILACYFTGWDTQYKLTAVPLDFNVIYLFNAQNGGNNQNGGAWSWPFSNVTLNDVQQVRARGQRVILSLGGAGLGFAYTNRTQSQNCINSVQNIIASLGGVDGVDFNFFEAGIRGTISEVVWIAQRLKEIYGSNFAITCPPGAINTGGAPVNGIGMSDSYDLDLAVALKDANCLTYAAPQFYDWSFFNQAGSISGVAAQWVAALGADKVALGLSANYANGPSLADCQREWDTVVAASPTIRGAFCWNAQTNLQGGNAWGASMKARVGSTTTAPPPASAPAPAVGDLLPGAGTTVQKIQAENATREGSLYVETPATSDGYTWTGFEGNGWVSWFTTSADILTFDFTGVTAGLYDVYVRTTRESPSPQKYQINGGPVVDAIFPGAGFPNWGSEMRIAGASLAAGNNQLKLMKGDGWYHVDYARIEPARGSVAAPPPPPAAPPAGGGEGYPFASRKTAYPAGSIKPTNVTQAQMDQTLRTCYDNWKATLVRPANAIVQGGYIVRFAYDGSLSYVSEGLGMGLTMVAAMAGHDANARTICDGLIRVGIARPAYGVSGLAGAAVGNKILNWKVGHNGEPDGASGGGDGWGAHDGDFEFIFGLLMCHRQWGSNGAINYRQEAIDRINACKAWYMYSDGRIHGIPFENAMRTSDVMPQHFQAFYDATGDAFWLTAKEVNVRVLERFVAAWSPAFAIIPDEIIDTHTTTPRRRDSTAGGSLDNGQAYTRYMAYNAQRNPWKLGVAAVMEKDPAMRARLKALCDKFTNFVKADTSGFPERTATIYDLNGTVPSSVGGQRPYTNGWYPWGMIGPQLCAAMVDASHQQYLNSLWAFNRDFFKLEYYNAELQFLPMLLASGNWWHPTDIPA